MNFSAYRVLFEFKRIQTYLFFVPKMRTILGANALMGEVLRLHLPQLARKYDSSLPCGMTIPEFKKYPGDPLALSSNSDAHDNPGIGYKNGVLTRDGGHFQALFPSSEKAIEFCDAATRLIQKHMMGLMFDVKVEQWQPDVSDNTLTSSWKSLQNYQPLALECLTPSVTTSACEWSGQDEATHRIREGKTKLVSVSRKVRQQWLAGRRFMRGKTQDIAGLIEGAVGTNGLRLLPCRGSGWAFPTELRQLVGGGGRYLALVLIDGNSISTRKPRPDEQHKLTTETDQDAFVRWLESESRIELFFHSMRAQTRRALVDALNITYGSLAPSTVGGVSPYQLLMVGGDDVLVVTRAEYALPLAKHFVLELEKDDRHLIDGKPLHIGAGIVIAKHTYRFHALHALAEDLMASAKRLARSPTGGNCSVVDWAIATSFRNAVFEAHRRQHDIVRYRVNSGIENLILNSRPYPIRRMSDGIREDGRRSLEDLLAGAEALRSERDLVARSQRKSLPEALRLGRLVANDAVADLPGSMRDKLAAAGVISAENDAWLEVDHVSSDERFYRTHLADLLEIAEIPDLGAVL